MPNFSSSRYLCEFRPCCRLPRLPCTCLRRTCSKPSRYTPQVGTPCSRLVLCTPEDQVVQGTYCVCVDNISLMHQLEHHSSIILIILDVRSSKSTDCTEQYKNISVLNHPDIILNIHLHTSLVISQMEIAISYPQRGSYICFVTCALELQKRNSARVVARRNEIFKFWELLLLFLLLLFCSGLPSSWLGSRE